MKGAWKDWRFWTALLLVCAVVWALLSGKADELSAALQMAKNFAPLTLLSAFCLCTLQVLCMGFRAWCLCPASTPVRAVLWAISYGQLANAFFPARAGDALKVAVLGDAKKGAGIPYATATGVILADKVIDLAGIIFWILCLKAPTVEQLWPSFSLWNTKTVLLILLVHGVIFLAWRFWLKARLTKIDRKLGELRQGLKPLLVLRHSLPGILFSIATWGCEVFALHLLISGMGYTFPLSYVGATLVVLNLAISIPVSVANLGTFEASVVFALGKLGVATAPAIAIAVVHHTLQLLGAITSAGFCRLLRQR